MSITSSPILIRITDKKPSAVSLDQTASGNATTLGGNSMTGRGARAGPGNAPQTSEFLHLVPRVPVSIVQVVEVIDKKKRDARLLDLLEEYHGAQVLATLCPLCRLFLLRVFSPPMFHRNRQNDV